MPRGKQINSGCKLEALEIEHEILDAVKKAGTGGLSFKDGCEIIGMDYDHFYYLVHLLAQLGRFQIARSVIGNQGTILLPDADLPVFKTLTDKQKEVFDVLCSVADDENLAVLSFKKIAERTSCRCPALALERLDYKGLIEFVDRGTHETNIYRVYPNRDGPRGYSRMRWQR